jgi:hypothetical protein
LQQVGRHHSSLAWVDQSLLENERERPHSHFVFLVDALFGTGIPVRTGSTSPIDLSVP